AERVAYFAALRLTPAPVRSTMRRSPTTPRFSLGVNSISDLLLLPILLTLNASAPTVHGQYVEARTCDVYTGSCFANADTGIVGKNAVLAWKIESGTVKGLNVDGLGVLAVIAARDTLGLTQPAPGRGIIIVDEKATTAQCDALAAFARAQAGDLLGEVIAVRSAPFDLTICNCDGEGCATLKAGSVKIATRCIDADHDKACGNEATLYP